MEDNIRRNTGKDIGELKSVEVTKRGAGDVALVLTAVGSKCTVTVETAVSYTHLDVYKRQAENGRADLSRR